jgi:hypothetical protein
MPDTLPFDPSILSVPITGGYGQQDAQSPSIDQLKAMFGNAIPTTPQDTSNSQQQDRPGKGAATVRYNNPGGMWDGESASKFGSKTHGILPSGNHIAYFDTPEAGAAAQFDLLSTDKYTGQSILGAINTWSGGTGGTKNVADYAMRVAQAAGVSPLDKITGDMLRGPGGIALAKNMARWETGYDYPMSDDQWRAAQKMAFPDMAQR